MDITLSRHSGTAPTIVPVVPRTMRLTGIALSAIVFLVMIASAYGKFEASNAVVALWEHLGLPASTRVPIGTVELLTAALRLIPRTAFLGAILATGYFGGAVLAHLRVGDPFLIPLLMGVLAWVGFALRRPNTVRHAFDPSAQFARPTSRTDVIPEARS